MREYTFVIRRTRGRIEIEPLTRQTSAFDVIEKAVTDFDVAVDVQSDVTVTLYWTWLGPDDRATVSELDEVAEAVRTFVKGDVYIEVGRNTAGAMISRLTGPRQQAPYGLKGAEASAHSLLRLKPEIAYVEVFHHDETGYPVRTIRRDDMAN